MLTLPNSLLLWQTSLKPAATFSRTSVGGDPPTFHIADPTIAKQIFASRTTFPKPVKNYKHIQALFGPNVLTTVGSMWVRHRKISAPAFSDSNMQLVFDQAVRIVNDMFDADWVRQGQRVVLQQAERTMADVSSSKKKTCFHKENQRNNLGIISHLAHAVDHHGSRVRTGARLACQPNTTSRTFPYLPRGSVECP